MKKIKLKSLVDTQTDNIDDIYSNIVKELNLGTKETKNKNLDNYIKQCPKPTKPKKDEDLLLAMTKRLNVVESKLKEYANVIKDKDKEITKLKKELNNEKDKHAICDNCIKLNKVIDRQNEFINKLYAFLQENGITIIDSAKDPKAKSELDTKIKHLENELNKLHINNTNELNTDNHSSLGTTVKETDDDDDDDNGYNPKKLPRTIDIKTLSRRIDEMNNLIYEEGNASSNFVSEDGKIFKLAHRKEIQITFFQNGLVIEGYQFFNYNSVPAQKILQDIIDGYSPYILKERYPNGVIMKTVNNLHLSHDSSDNNNNKVGSCLATGEKKYISGREFANMFPEKVIKNGRVLHIREDMEKILNLAKPASSTSDIDTEKETYEIYDKTNTNENDVAKIKVQITTVNKAVFVLISKHSKIQPLFDFIQKYTNACLAKTSLTLKIKTIKDYAFIINYPFQVITYDNANTIEELKMHPSIFVTFDTAAKYEPKK